MLKIAGSNQAGIEISFNSITVIMITSAMTEIEDKTMGII